MTCAAGSLADMSKLDDHDDHDDDFAFFSCTLFVKERKIRETSPGNPIANNQTVAFFIKNSEQSAEAIDEHQQKIKCLL